MLRKAANCMDTPWGLSYVTTRQSRLSESRSMAGRCNRSTRGFNGAAPGKRMLSPANRQADLTTDDRTQNSNSISVILLGRNLNTTHRSEVGIAHDAETRPLPCAADRIRSDLCSEAIARSTYRFGVPPGFLSISANWLAEGKIHHAKSIVEVGRTISSGAIGRNFSGRGGWGN